MMMKIYGNFTIISERVAGEEKAKERFVEVHADMLDSILSKIKRQRNE